MSVWGAENIHDKELERLHREERVSDLQEIRGNLPEEKKQDIDRLWQLIKEASGG